ncbi:MAG: NAD-dependent succinate-semialdehyde dehydrogenase [Acidimicrobiales bacterium]|nr:NAD-dependent succinate-semialdehyde dehydrogenase [Acidimicrobiales bacterium]
MAEGRCYIGGEWVGTDRTFEVTNPADGTVVGAAADADAALATRAVAAAHDAFGPWAALPAPERAAALRRITAALLDDIDRIADLIVAEQGKPRGQALFEVRYATQWLDWFAEEARRVYGEIIPTSVPGKRLMVHRKPLGVAVAITPWNFPLAMIARKLAPALAAGCTIVVKPAEQTPLSPAALFEAIDAAGLPPGVANLVISERPEPLSDALLGDERVRKITFTGSTEVGKLLVRRSADHLARVSLELGGQAPFIVFDDADLDAAVAGVLASKFQVNGQSCLCANRIFVQEGVMDAFAEKLSAAVGGLVVGRGDTAGTDVGPLIDDRGYEKVSSHVADAVSKGASVVVGGERVTGEGFDGGYFFAPTVLAGCDDDMLVATEETFGPVAPLLAFQDEDEVIRRANNTPYGLAAYYYTRDLGRAMRVAEALEYGLVGCNDPMPASPTAPFGGFKESGLGREGGHEGIDAFVESKLVSIVV